MARRAGAYGPYAVGSRWRVVVVDRTGKTTSRIFATEAEAKQVIRSTNRQAHEDERTGKQLIEAYEVHLRTDKGNKAKSYTATTWRLSTFFVDYLEASPSALTPKSCASAYDDLTTRVSERTKKTFSVDSHRNMLAEAKTF